MQWDAFLILSKSCLSCTLRFGPFPFFKSVLFCKSHLIIHFDPCIIGPFPWTTWTFADRTANTQASPLIHPCGFVCWDCPKAVVSNFGWNWNHKHVNQRIFVRLKAVIDFIYSFIIWSQYLVTLRVWLWRNACFPVLFPSFLLYSLYTLHGPVLFLWLSSMSLLAFSKAFSSDILLFTRRPDHDSLAQISPDLLPNVIMSRIIYTSLYFSYQRSNVTESTLYQITWRPIFFKKFYKSSLFNT